MGRKISPVLYRIKDMTFSCVKFLMDDKKGRDYITKNKNKIIIEKDFTKKYNRIDNIKNIKRYEK
jgi:hypothetical protein